MKNSFYVFCISLALLCSPLMVKAQQPKNKNAVVSLSSGITLTFTSKTDPESYGFKDIGSFEVAGENGVVHRAYLDQASSVYFGYDVVVESTGEYGEYKLTFRPLTTIKYIFISNDVITDQGRKKTSRSGELKAMALQKYPEPQRIRNGDTVEFEVLINPKTGVKIIDSIKVSLSLNNSMPPRKISDEKSLPIKNEEAADFNVDEIELTIKNPQLRVNDKSLLKSRNAPKIEASGTLVWFYLPEYGRFILSLVPRKGYGFQKIGTVQNNKINFTIGGVKYDWISDSPVVTGGNKRWNLWVLHEPDYRPTVALSKQLPYQAGAARRIEQLAKKK